MTKRKIDKETRSWIRNAADEKAAAEGCRFDGERGEFVVHWIRKCCRLYEGDDAGKPMELTDWQYDATMRLFGWIRWSDRWGRWVRRFRQASIWVAKKNKKSPTLAAWGLYLLAGDGELGGKVYFGAKDGQQVREIVGRHAVEMMDQSPELSAECTLNKNLMQIAHERTRSIMKPMSSSNVRTQKSKEGINGSILIDETHVVDREFMARISRAGISRSEPLRIEASTAGNDPDSYGKERFDHAVEVERGTKEDPSLFVAIYAAPQDLADADLDADPLKYGRMANPAMLEPGQGHSPGKTVDPQEFLEDYNQSKASAAALADFKMYRLNIWQRSSSPFIHAAHWDACRQDYSEDDLSGKTCYAGLDLSKTRDMSALVLVFPRFESGELASVRLLPYFFLPEEYARENDHIVSYGDWARDGHLTLTPGDVIDYGWIKSTFRRLAERFKVRQLAYDPLYAEELTQALSEGVRDDRGQLLEEGTGVERVLFRQTITQFAGPTAEFERLVISGNLGHNGNPILSWQAGHVEVRTDANQNMRPVKPPRNEHKKIDGIVASIMGLGQALEDMPTQKESIYEQGGRLL